MLIGILFSCNLAYSKSYILTDLETGTVAFPPLFEQIRSRLIKDNFPYSFKKGHLLVYLQKSKTEVCISFANSDLAQWMIPELEKDFVSPPNSKIPSAMEIVAVSDCY
jgi:hypothetical protein